MPRRSLFFDTAPQSLSLRTVGFQHKRTSKEFDMRLILTAIAIGVIALPLGCGRGTSGGPGATDPPTTPSVTGQAEDTFSLSVSNTKINQGDTKNVTININRGRNFGQDVAVKVGNLPSGITLVPASPKIAHGDADTEFALTASRDAALGVFTISVTGQPTTGAAAVAEMKVTVAEYDADSVSREASAEEREAWQRDITAKEAEVDRLAAEHQNLQGQARDATGQEKANLEAQAEQAKVRHDVAKAQLDEQKSANPSTWTRLKDSVSSVTGN
jgi:Skp family chaperone for outer membrane proteins